MRENKRIRIRKSTLISIPPIGTDYANKDLFIDLLVGENSSNKNCTGRVQLINTTQVVDIEALQNLEFSSKGFIPFEACGGVFDHYADEEGKEMIRYKVCSKEY